MATKERWTICAVTQGKNSGNGRKPKNFYNRIGVAFRNVNEETGATSFGIVLDMFPYLNVVMFPPQADEPQPQEQAPQDDRFGVPDEF